VPNLLTYFLGMLPIKTIIMTGRHKDDCHEMMASQWVDGWLFNPFGLKQLDSMLSLLRVGI
jgi:two-component system response regulator ResD